MRQLIQTSEWMGYYSNIKRMMSWENKENNMNKEDNELSLSFQEEKERLLELAQEMDNLQKAWFQKACESGEILLSIKISLPHGQWEKWIERNFLYTSKTANKFIKIFENQELLNESYEDPNKATEKELLATIRNKDNVEPKDNYRTVNTYDDKSGSYHNTSLARRNSPAEQQAYVKQQEIDAILGELEMACILIQNCTIEETKPIEKSARALLKAIEERHSDEELEDSDEYIF